MEIKIGKYPIEDVFEMHCDYIAASNKDLSAEEVTCLAYFEGLSGLAERIDAHIAERAPILNLIKNRKREEKTKRQRGRPKKEK